MAVKNIDSFNTLQNELSKAEKSFLLLYKKGSEQSDCAFRNLSKVESEIQNIIFTADVNQVRDIHEKYQVTTVPILLEFNGERMIKTIKGCHEPGFFRSLFEESLYSVINKEEKAVKKVVVYTTPTCPHCTTLKNYLKDNKILFRDINVAQDQKMAEAMVKKSGQQGVPQIEINGRIVVGFNRPKIDELLEIR